MSELLDKVRSHIEPIVTEQGLLLDKFEYQKRGREYYLVIYVEKEDDVTTLDEVCAVSDLISKKAVMLEVNCETDFVAQNDGFKKFVSSIRKTLFNSDVTTLDEVCAVSDLISKKLDEIDLITDNYVLDVSTSGAEKPIKDFSKFNKYVGKYIYVKLRNPVEGLNDYTGTLEEASEEEIKLSYKVKTRTKYVTIEVANITKANLAIKF